MILIITKTAIPSSLKFSKLQKWTIWRNRLERWLQKTNKLKGITIPIPIYILQGQKNLPILGIKNPCWLRSNLKWKRCKTDSKNKWRKKTKKLNIYRISCWKLLKNLKILLVKGRVFLWKDRFLNTNFIIIICLKHQK
jgi:hypothetical protein